MKPEYPVEKDGVPVNPYELPFPESRLNLDKRKSYHNHHLYFNSGRYRQHIITNSLRDAERHQLAFPRDLHVMGGLALHNYYEQPPMPTMHQAMDVLDEMFVNEEKFKVWNNTIKRYELHDFTAEHMGRLTLAYNHILR